MQQWDGTKWVKVSDWIAPMKDKVRPLLEAAAKDYVSKDPAWPKRTRALRQVVADACLSLSPLAGRVASEAEPGGVAMSTVRAPPGSLRLASTLPARGRD